MTKAETAVGCFVGLDVGGTNIQGVALRAGEICNRGSLGTPDSPVDAVVEMARLALELSGDDCRGVGVGLPGVVDRELGRAGFLPNLPSDWHDRDLGSELSEALGGRPVYLLNDARLATYGELRHGAGRRFDSVTMLVLTLGTGIGGGVVVDGRLRLGPRGSAGELGHQLYDRAGLRCACGARGCVETVATGPALSAEGVRLLSTHQAPALERIVDGDWRRVSPKTMAMAASEDEAVARAIQRVGEALGVAVANGIVSLHPDLVVLCGGMSALGELVLGPLRRTVDERVRVFDASDVAYEVSELGDLAGALGGAALARAEGVV